MKPSPAQQATGLPVYLQDRQGPEAAGSAPLEPAPPGGVVTTYHYDAGVLRSFTLSLAAEGPEPMPGPHVVVGPSGQEPTDAAREFASGYADYAGLALATRPNPNSAEGRLLLGEGVGLQYNRARWYAPGPGKWLNEDPLGYAGDDTGTVKRAYTAR